MSTLPSTELVGTSGIASLPMIMPDPTSHTAAVPTDSPEAAAAPAPQKRGRKAGSKNLPKQKASSNRIVRTAQAKAALLAHLNQVQKPITIQEAMKVAKPFLKGLATPQNSVLQYLKMMAKNGQIVVDESSGTRLFTLPDNFRANEERRMSKLQQGRAAAQAERAAGVRPPAKKKGEKQALEAIETYERVSLLINRVNAAVKMLEDDRLTAHRKDRILEAAEKDVQQIETVTLSSGKAVGMDPSKSAFGQKLQASLAQKGAASMPADLKLGIVKSSGNLRIAYKGLKLEIGVIDE